MFTKLTSLQAYLLIAIALGAAGFLSVPSFQVARSQLSDLDRCNDAGGTINEDGECLVPPASSEPKCQYDDWVYVPEMGRCAPGPPILDGGNPASGDNVDNATQDGGGS